MNRGWWFGMAGLAGCSDDADDSSRESASTDDGPDGACGAVTAFDTTIVGAVEDAAGNPLAGADVWLEERNWAPGVKGTTTSGADGRISMPVSDLTVVEDCWGTAVLYYLVGESGGLTGERPMNTILIPAWMNGTDADLGAFPLVLESSGRRSPR